MSEARYVIIHHSGLFTELTVEYRDGRVQRLDTPDWTWAQVRAYCFQSLAQHGLVWPVIQRPEPGVEVFPWVALESC